MTATETASPSPDAAAPTRRKPGPASPDVDWTLIRRRFEAGMSLRDCVLGQQVTGEAARQRAKREGWQRKLGKPPPRADVDSLATSLPSLQDYTQVNGARTPQTAAKVLTALANGIGYGRAAAIAGIAPMTLQAWRKDDPVFDEACNRARASILGEVETSLFGVAKSGDVAAQKFVLKTAKETRAEYQEDELKPAVSVIFSFLHSGDNATDAAASALDITPDATVAPLQPAAAPALPADLIDE